MTNKEKKDTLDNMLICYVDKTNLTNKQIEESKIFVEELRAAISVTHCCAELKDKKITDLLNWVKSDLAQETNVKLGKTANPYRTEKLKFLNKLLEIKNL